jgi:hypothetical protein
MSYAFPGGYPIYYLAKDCGVLCPECAGLPECAQASPDDSQWYLIGAECNYENPALSCDHCGKRIESAYCEEAEEQEAGQGSKAEEAEEAEEQEAENLDCMPLSDLQAYCQQANHPALLREYAATKARAIETRLAGLIPQALQWESACDNLYKLLPSNLKW